MRITSLNSWGGRLHDRLVAYLAATAPDVLCLQEVVHSPDTTRDWLDYRDGDHVLPQRANLFRDIRGALPDHAAYFCPAARGVLWDGDRPVPSHWGLATFIRGDVAIVAQRQGFVHKAYSAHGYGEHPRPRNAHVVRVHDAARDRYVTVGHMHGLRDPAAGKRDTPERVAQAGRLAALVASVAEADDAVTVCGDFNVEPDSATFAILAEHGLTDLVATTGAPGTRTSHYAKPGRFADYMLVNDRVAVRRFAVVTAPEVSDHCPLDLEL